MDGNGRWAKRQRLPRIAGHRRGVESVRAAVAACAERGVGYLTLFAFSSENWRRPAEEVALLMQLFPMALSSEVEKLHRNGVRLKVVGDLGRFEPNIRRLIEQGERLTADNQRLTLTIAANYGGRWDILQALSRLLEGERSFPAKKCARSMLAPYLAMSYAPEPDLFIRTGGEQRISNFLLWQLAYTRALLHRAAVAGLRRRGARRGDRVLPRARAALRAHQRAARSSRRRAEVA